MFQTPTKPEDIVLRPVFDRVYVSTDSTAVTVMMVSDRAEARSVYLGETVKVPLYLVVRTLDFSQLLGQHDQVTHGGNGTHHIKYGKICTHLQVRDPGSEH